VSRKKAHEENEPRPGIFFAYGPVGISVLIREDRMPPRNSWLDFPKVITMLSLHMPRDAQMTRSLVRGMLLSTVEGSCTVACEAIFYRGCGVWAFEFARVLLSVASWLGPTVWIQVADRLNRPFPGHGSEGTSGALMNCQNP
jgi:hypothetical protein